MEGGTDVLVSLKSQRTTCYVVRFIYIYIYKYLNKPPEHKRLMGGWEKVACARGGGGALSKHFHGVLIVYITRNGKRQSGSACYLCYFTS